jgi:hypothetical protein
MTCVAGLVLHGGVCKKPLGKDEVCAPRLQGELNPCTSPFFCGPGDLTCQPPRKEGESCVQALCEPALICQAGVCQKVPQPLYLPNGASCAGSGKTCQVGLLCQREPGSTAATCQPLRALAAPCLSDAECAGIASCVGKVCVALATVGGESCDDRSCDLPAWCDTSVSPATCRPPKPLASACGKEEECYPDVCDQGVCVAPVLVCTP